MISNLGTQTPAKCATNIEGPVRHALVQNYTAWHNAIGVRNLPKVFAQRHYS